MFWSQQERDSDTKVQGVRETAKAGEEGPNKIGWHCER